MRATACLLCLGAIVCSAQPAAKHRILFNRFRVPESALFIADADGKNERRLTTHGESEYSPSLSLNGNWVAFTSERMGQADIYRVHPDGTGLEQLTNDPAFDDQAALSPDAGTLAFVSTRGNGHANIWLLEIASKKLRNLTNGSSGNFRPSWSPDGKWIAFSSDRDSDPGTIPFHWEHMQSLGIYVVRPDGSGLRRLTRTGGVAGSPTWSADGKKILYYETDELGAYMAKNAQSRIDIVSIDVATGKKTGYTASNETKFAPQWLPDGRISYVVRSNAADAEGLRVWYPDRRVVAIAKGMIRHSTWTADGKQVIYDRILQPASTQRMVPTFSRDPDFELFLNEPFPSFSPDGRKLLYSFQAGNGTNPVDTSIEVMNADGTGITTLFRKEGYSAYNAVWSPSGDEVALSVGHFFRSPGLPAAPIALVKSDGSGYREVVDDGVNNGFPSWAPDGKRLVYRHGKQLMILTLAEGKSVPLTDGSHYDNFPQWSPKGDSIMFTSDRAGDFQIFTMRLDGTGIRQLTNEGINAHSVWSPDGEWVAFTSGRKGFKDEMALNDREPQPYGEIFAMRPNGSDVRQLTDNKWEDATPCWAPEVKAPATASRR